MTARWVQACTTLLTETWKPSAAATAIVRITAGLWILVAFPVAGMRSVSRIPTSFWEPPLSMMRLLDSPPPEPVLLLLSCVLTASTMLLVLGFLTPVASVVSGIALTATQTIQMSYGAPLHRMLLPTLLIAMSASGWGNRFSLDARLGRTTRPQPWPIAIVLLFVTVLMFSSGWAKLTSGWLDPRFSAVEGHVQWVVFWKDAHATYLAAPLTSARPPWEIADFATVMLELGFILVIWRQRWARALLVAALLFHFGILLVFDIPFVENVFVYMAAFPLTVAVAAFERGEKHIGTGGFVAVLAIAAVIAALLGGFQLVPRLVLKEAPLMVAPVLALAGFLPARRFFTAA